PITIPNSVTSIGEGAFFGCGSLKDVTIPNSVTSIGAEAFRNCSSLKDVYNYVTTPQSIYSNTFIGLSSNKTLHVVKGCKPAYASTNYWKDFTIVEDLEPTAVKNIKKYKDNNLDDNIYNWQGFKGEGQINIKNRKKFVK
ncbi:MAG: leucine-rich repeat protein, partial [Prevotellaceae bacterium]|nr:leucine-rich repeat protein [Candidatus Faecinaster equi]